MNLVKELRERAGMQQKEVALAVGVSRPTVSEWEHQKKDPSGERLLKLAELFKVDPGIVLGYQIGEKEIEASNADALRIPVLGTIPAGIPLEAITDIIDWEEIPTAMAKGEQEYFALQVKGSSMYPEYRDGDVVIVRKQETCESGQDVVVMVNTDDATFKRFKRTPKGIMLQAINPDYESYVYTNDEIMSLPVRVLGVVVELRRKF